MREGASVRRLERELAGCEVVCVNCHRLRTASREKSWRVDPACVDDMDGLTACERRNMAYIRQVLTRSRCIDCGDSRLIVLEFDHVGTKSGHVVELARRGCSLSRLQAEISQCEIRCSNCHRRRTSRLKLTGPPDSKK